MGNNIMGNRRTALFVFIVFFISMAIGFQNCSSDEFATQGNGQPYEGLTVNGDTGRPDGSKDPDNSTNSGGNQAIVFDTEYLCENPESLFYNEIRFGIDDEEPTILLKNSDNEIAKKTWKRKHRLQKIKLDINERVSLRFLLLYKSFRTTGKMLLRFKDKESGHFNETFVCTKHSAAEAK